ncbi:MAG: methyltransferase domain-containing protein [Burkholderiales bacterium]|nr:methyltransferase domain-containing protein [Burkholderiales bacterium]
MRDPYRYVNDLDPAAVQQLIRRLESRAQDPVFTTLLDKYLGQLNLAEQPLVLDVGCGTGAFLRRLLKRDDFTGLGFGIDQSQEFIDAAVHFANAEGLLDRLTFRTGDVHQLGYPNATFDIVIANTLLSHVTDPMSALVEMGRVLRPGGTMVIFDGDYSSLSYAYPDHHLAQEMNMALANCTFNNPALIQDLPRLLPACGLRVLDAWGDAVTEIGYASYFRSFAETFVPYVEQSGMLPTSAVACWYAYQSQAWEKGTFFASCNYYTFLITRS